MKVIHIKIREYDKAIISGVGPCQFGKDGFLRIYNLLVSDDFELTNLIFNNTIMSMIDNGTLINEELNIKRILFSKTFKKLL
jgi:hypothetical protein